MNIFVLDENPIIAASAVCDRHVCKMPIESTQMVCTVLWQNNIEAPYRPTHSQHPCVKWIASNATRWAWHALYTQILFLSYTARYKRTHATESKYHEAMRLAGVHLSLPEGELHPFPKCVPEQYKHMDSVQAYREYYRNDKRKIAFWRHGEMPEWMSTSDTSTKLNA